MIYKEKPPLQGKKYFSFLLSKNVVKKQFLCDFKKKYSDNRIIGYFFFFSLLAGSDGNAFSKTVESTWDMPTKTGERGKISGQIT